jgi:N-acetylneuraminic acid mutarotase
MSKLRICQVVLVIFISIYLVACGGSNSTPVTTTGGSGSSGSSTANYKIGGNVSGLSGSGLVLQNNGKDNLVVSKAGTFTFSDQEPSGSAYKVTVLTQPSVPTQTCSVTNGSGTVKANVAVQISCTTTTFNVSGTVQGLVGVGLVLQDNLSDSLTVTSNGSFAFSTAVDGGMGYDVTVLEQPVTPAQICSPSNATGTANANVTTVNIVCVDDIPAGDWNWIGGADVPNQIGSYGTIATASAKNVPGARFNAVTWTDAQGNFWLFGGNGYSSATSGFGLLNDFWKYYAGEWTSMGGSESSNQSGVYGTPLVASADNIPGARESAVSWVDAKGNFWLFGGSGPDSTGFVGYMNDLWEYNGGKWTWVNGANIANQSGSYGTEGVASATNIPTSRSGAVEWTDASGNFWIFGGFGIDSSGAQGSLSDLWKYSNGQWTWVGGSNLAGQAGVYGTQDVAAAANMPGGRNSAMSWIDADGNFWLFGGVGLDSTDKMGDLNDMWKYSGGDWTWVGGSDLEGQQATYGSEGVAASTNVPGARDSALALTDAAGNFWLFAGNGYASTTTRGGLNDIWKFSAGQWTWMGGSSAVNKAGVYGTLSTPSAENLPGGRGGPAGRIDAAGGIWIFGGEQGLSTQFNDLWMYQP